MLFSWSEVFDGFQHAPVFGGSPHGDAQAALASRDPRTVADDHPCGDQFAVKPVGIGGLHQQEVGLRRVDPLDAAASGERRRQPSAFFADLRDLRRNVPAQTLGRGLLGERIDICLLYTSPVDDVQIGYRNQQYEEIAAEEAGFALRGCPPYEEIAQEQNADYELDDQVVA